VMPKVGLEPT